MVYTESAQFHVPPAMQKPLSVHRFRGCLKKKKKKKKIAP